MQPPQDLRNEGSAPRHTPSVRTLAARAGSSGSAAGAAEAGQPLVPAIAQTTVYTYPSLEALEAVYGGEEPGHIYYRQGHANGEALEEAVAALEGAEATVTAASGMAAISAGMLATLTAGDHMLADRNVYGGTHALLTEELARLGIAATLVDAANEGALEAALRPETKLLHLEALSNPMLRVCDLPRVIGWAKARGLVVTVDNTFATPALMRPIEYGADLVFHSLPKYLGGHSAAMGGVAAGRRELVEEARARLMHLGGTLGPFDAWMALGGLKTLGLRMRAHSENALAVARFLARHPAVTRVEHPGLPTHPQHALAQTLYPHGTGGMLAFEVAGGHGGATRLVRALAGHIPLAPSLADVATTVSYPAGTSHRSLSAEARAALGISDGLLRLSVGIEDADDILTDLEKGLEAVE
jgi:cystathionine gamma-synthase